MAFVRMRYAVATLFALSLVSGCGSSGGGDDDDDDDGTPLPGSVDPSFGTDGRVWFSSGPDVRDGARAVTVLPDGKLLGVGESDYAYLSELRLLEDGTPDPTFGTGGYRGDVSTRAAAAVVQDAQGRVLMVGGMDAASTYARRLNSDGSPDGTFGTAGKAALPLDMATDVVMSPAGVAWVVGISGTGAEAQFGLVKLDGDGVDTSFGTAGLGRYDIPGHFVISSMGPAATALGPRALVLDESTVYVAGTIVADGGLLSKAVLVAASATPAGVVVNWYASAAYDTVGLAAAPGPGGTLLFGFGGDDVGGESMYRVARLQPSLALDLTFGDEGIRSLMIPALGLDVEGMADMEVDAQGRVLLAGSYSFLDERGFVVARLQADGSVDAAFGQSGASFVSFESGLNAEGNWARDLELQPDGAIIVAGAGWFQSERGYRFVRLLP